MLLKEIIKKNSKPGVCVPPPPHQRRRGTHSPGGEGSIFNISEDARHWIGLLQYNPSTVVWIAVNLPGGLLYRGAEVPGLYEEAVFAPCLAVQGGHCADHS